MNTLEYSMKTFFFFLIGKSSDYDERWFQGRGELFLIFGARFSIFSWKGNLAVSGLRLTTRREFSVENFFFLNFLGFWGKKYFHISLSDKKSILRAIIMKKIFLGYTGVPDFYVWGRKKLVSGAHVWKNHARAVFL